MTARKVVCAVQARMGSTRLPGKVLADLGGRPMLRFILDRLRDVSVDRLVVATSTHAQDDAVADVAQAAGVDVVRGSESDVLSRYCAVLDTFPADAVVRVTGDCPFVDPEVVDAVIDLHYDREADYTSNVLPRTFPKGIDVEVVDAAVLREADREAADPGEREHVTPFVYRRPERFRLANLSNPEHLGGERWTVDTPEDLALAREVVDRLGADPGYGWRAILAVLGRRSTVDSAGLRLRLATEHDGDVWAVHPRNARHWLATRLDDPASRLWVAEVGGETVGALRLQVAGGVGDIGVFVEERFRDQDLYRQLLLAGQAQVLDDWQIVALEALVQPHDQGSLRALRSVGFAPAGSRGDLLVLRWEKPKAGPERPGPEPARVGRH